MKRDPDAETQPGESVLSALCKWFLLAGVIPGFLYDGISGMIMGAGVGLAVWLLIIFIWEKAQKKR